MPAKTHFYNYAIVILSYNHPDLTQKTITSVLQLGFPASQIYLVHNGSLQKHQKQLTEQFQEIHHLLYETNLGFTGGANRGLDSVFQKYEQAFFLTNDTLLMKLPEVFPQKIDLLAPLIWRRQSAEIDSLMGALNIKTGQLRHLKNISNLKSTTEIAYVPGTAFGLTKKCYDTLGGFDESFHTYWEDVDFSLRAHKANFQIEHSPTFQLRHKIGKTCHKDRFYTLYLFQRNRRRLMKKHHLLSLRFWFQYSLDLSLLFFKITQREDRQISWTYWWRAITE